MKEILLVRHAKSLANKRDFTAFGNIDSPLEEEKGVPSAVALNALFRNTHGIIPEEYDRPVLASEYRRPQQTAELAGFRYIEVDPILNEVDFDRKGLSPAGTVLKHARERWVPEEAAERAARIIKLIRSGGLGYQIYFSHGIPIASIKQHVVDEAVAEGNEPPYDFVVGHGYIPDLATVTPVIL